MPWKETCRMKLREEFVLKALEPNANVAELCREHRISRKTGYKWLRRFHQRGISGLRDLSRRPHHSPLRADGEMVVEVVRLRGERPRWGPKKLRAVLLRQFAPSRVPSVRTIARIIDRAGLVEPKRVRCSELRSRPIDAPGVSVQAPNDLWTVDFKGWWRSQDGHRCEPLTVRDGYSRYVLCAKLMSSTSTEHVRPIFERLFEQFGLPAAIQVDNGSPFASTRARGGLTALSAWWVSLGIRVVRGRPSHPEDNGAHERMHFDLRFDVEDKRARTVGRQQHLLDVWVHDFNHVRPHEALGQRTPAEVYVRSPRPLRDPLPPLYPPGYVVRKVACNGVVTLAGARLPISMGLRGQFVGVRQLDVDRAQVRFYDIDLGEVEIPTPAA
jgi:transposase InsO family protein